MDKLKELISLVLEKGFATTDERECIREQWLPLETKDAEAVAEDMDKIEDLPFEKPENKSDDGQDNEDGKDGQEGNEGESESVTGGETRAERRAKARAENLK